MREIALRRLPNPGARHPWPHPGWKRTIEQRQAEDAIYHPVVEVDGRPMLCVFRSIILPQTSGYMDGEENAARLANPVEIEDFALFLPEVHAYLIERGTLSIHTRNFGGHDVQGGLLDLSILLDGDPTTYAMIRHHISNDVRDIGTLLGYRDLHLSNMLRLGVNARGHKILGHEYPEAKALFARFWPHQRLLRPEWQPIPIDARNYKVSVPHIAPEPFQNLARVAGGPFAIYHAVSKAWLLAKSEADLIVARLVGVI